MQTEAKTIDCHQCKSNACLKHYSEGVPAYCRASEYEEIIDNSRLEYHKPKAKDIHLATAKILKKGGYDWTRIQQCIEFAKELAVEKVGLAVCIGLLREGKEMARFLDRAGFQVVSVACMIGSLNPQETGIPEEFVTDTGIACNPIAQAGIMNEEGTQLNFIYGLCVGHDTLFIQYSKAPVTYVVVKDAVTGNNPSAVLTSTFHRMKLSGTYKKTR
jgi:uncharacterized metal-binding protein